MKSEVPFEAIEYGDGNGREVVALVAGFGSKPGELDQAGRDLSENGHDTVIYTYHPRILLAGDADLLPELVDTLYDDFLRRTPEYEKRRFGGVSLGGALAINMQKKHENPEPGIYAATGSDAASLVMQSRFFGAVVLATHKVALSRSFAANGYTITDLRERWHDFHEPPVSDITIALGGLDIVVKEREVMAKVRKWRAEGHNVRTPYKPWLGHGGMIKWFDNHAIELCD